MISQKSIQDVLNTARVEEVVGEFVNLKRRGANQVGLCPFHDEKTPSFYVSPAKNIYKCFGCGKGGNPAQFLMESEKMNFVESIRFLAEKYGITLEESEEKREEYEEQKRHQDSLFIVNEFARDYFKKQLLETNDGKAIGLSYFKERGYREEIIKNFDLGYANNKRTDFLDKAISKQYKKEYLRELGLTTEREHDFFNDRVMFTIHNLSGKPIAFAGRILTNNKKAPKYLNSPESEIYLKRKTLYGFYQAKESIRKNDFCILVEGYTDVLSLYQNGIKNVVASSGTSLTKEQLHLIKRFTNNLTILYDGDSAGINAAMRGLELALEADIDVKVVVLPEGEDPDSFVSNYGQQKVLEYIEKEQKDFILFKLANSAKDVLDDPVKRTKVTREIVDTLSNILDPIKRASYIQESSRHLKLEEALLTKEINKRIREKIKRKRILKEREDYKETGRAPYDDSDFISSSELGQQHSQKLKDLGDSYQEKDIIRIIMNFGGQTIEDEDGPMTVVQYIYKNIADVIQYFENEKHKEIIEIAMNRTESGKDIGPSFYTNNSDEGIQLLAIELLSTPHIFAKWSDKGVYLLTQSMPDQNFVSDSRQAIIRFKLKKVKKVIQKLQEQIVEIGTEGNEHDLNMHLKAFKHLQEERRNIAKELGNIFI